MNYLNLLLSTLIYIYRSDILELKGGSMSNTDDLSAYMTVGEARDLLGVSRPKMAQLIKDGVLIVRADALDKRVKLVSRAAVEALAAQSKKAA
jgi:excisionase family DNA binding protein